MLALVMKSKPIYKNILAYDTKTKEYVYLHAKKEIWREPSIDNSLLDYCNQKRVNDECIDHQEIEKLTEYPIYQKYSKSCELQ